MKKYVIIVAGGKGSRMASDIPKQFIQLNGLPILMHTIKQFSVADSSIKIVLVLPEDSIEVWKELVEKHCFDISHELVKGGKERFHSIQNGLKEISEEGVVAVHDGVRPLVSIETIERTFKEAENFGNAVPVINAVQSLRKVEKDSSIAVDRASYKIVQTPQCFRVSLLKKAYEQEYQSFFTDDASLVESIGEKIHLVKGNDENIKVTTPKDLIIAKALISNSI